MQKQFVKENSYIVKGIAIILLLMYHLFENRQLITSMEVNYSPFPLSDFLMLSGFGNICVAVFVFLTAYGISKGLLQNENVLTMDIYKQAWRRFLKLMFRFSFMYASVNLLWWYKFDYVSLYGSGKQGFLYMLTDALGLSMFFDTPTLNMTWWYMELAYILIFLIPVLAWLVQKVGYYILPLAFFLPTIISFQPDVERYFFTAAFGVCAAYGKWPDKLLNLKIKLIYQWIFVIVGFVLCIPIRQNFIIQESYDFLIDAPIALLLLFLGGLLSTVPVLNRMLEFIGKHSINIYLVHTFFYMALWQPYIYMFKYALLILVVLLVVCLLYSVVLEFARKWFLRALGWFEMLVKKWI